MKKIIAALMVIASLSACSDMPIKETTTIDIPTLDANVPQATGLEDVNWKVYTADDLIVIASDKDVVLFTLTKEEYEKMGRNIVEMRRYILQLKQTVIFYRNQNHRKATTAK